jgi:hypothetical protein
LTATQLHVDQFCSIVTAFLTQEDSSTTNPVDVQLGGLSVVKQLWNVMSNVFSASLLSVLAEKILAYILQQDYDLLDEKVNRVWSALCSDLMITGDPTFLVLIHAQDEHQKEKEVKRQLWSILAKVLPSFPERFTWQGIISFLLISLE